jgi:hypothetical protein
MKKHKLILLLKTCPEDELSQIELFLSSPFYNQNEDLIRLFHLLRKYHPEFTDPSLSKKKLFQALYPTALYEDKQLRYLFSDLNKALERFLAVRQIEKDPYQLSPALLKSLSERGLEKAYRQVNRNLETQSSKTTAVSIEFLLHKVRWSEIREEHFGRQQIRKFDYALQDVADDLDKYYFLHRLKISCAMLDRQTIFQSEYALRLSDDWLQHLRSQDFFSEPVIRIYYSILQALLDEQQEDHFEDLKQFLDQPPATISVDDLKSIYLHAINYCARKIRKGRESFVKTALELYRKGIETGLLINENGLSPWAFTNVVKLSLRLQHYQWIETFIQTYALQLPEAFRENALHYNLAELYYYTQRFEQSQEHLMQVAYSDLNYYLGARVLLAKIYYETDEEEALLSLLSSFTVFLKRNRQVSSNLKQTYLNFCRFLFQIVRRSPRQMKQLQEQIDSAKLLTDREWLQRVYREVLG